MSDRVKAMPSEATQEPKVRRNILATRLAAQFPRRPSRLSAMVRRLRRLNRQIEEAARVSPP